MESKVCKDCGRELPLSAFYANKFSGRTASCRECINEKRANTRYANRTQVGGGKTAPFSDPDFDGKDPGEVVRLMGRAKCWLESRGFIIQLSGEYHETKIKRVKFDV